MTTLDEFVTESLTQVTKGIEAFEKKRGKKVFEAPSDFRAFEAEHWGQYGIQVVGYDEDEAPSIATVLHFDVAVTAEESAAAGGGASVKVLGVFSAEGKGDLNATNSSVSRIRFSIPLTI